MQHGSTEAFPFGGKLFALVPGSRAQGVDIEHIMRLGGWETLDMVVRYTRSVKFEESLRLYKELGCVRGISYANRFSYSARSTRMHVGDM